jgi:hypothetical protein
MKLSRLKKIDLRQVWRHEALDFTNWLAQDENLSLLSDTVGVDISLIETEASVGKFNVDVLAEEQNTGRKIIIENQLEITDHDHLGKIITYASGYDAEIVVWIVREVREEHKKAVDWLNEITDESINFFAIKMEVWQIGDSDYAPRFSVVSEPNDWAKQIKATSKQPGKITETKTKQLEFWMNFREYAEERGTTVSLRKGRPQHWYLIKVGTSLATISLTVNSQTNEIGCEIYIRDSQELFDSLYANKDAIERALGGLELDWQPLESRKGSRIKIAREANYEDEHQNEENFAWLKDMAERFYAVFSKEIQKVTT